MSAAVIALEKLTELIGVEALHQSVQVVLKNRRAFAACLKAGVILRQSKLRVSFSELLRCIDGDEFLVIRSVKRPERFGPIGGVIRANKKGRITLESAHGFEFECKDGLEKYDLRGYINGKDFLKVLRWFYAQDGREQYALSREIVEELDETGLKELAANIGRLDLRLARIVYEGPSAVRGTDYRQYRLFHIYDIEDNDEGTAKFKKDLLKATSKHPDFLRVTREEILKGRSRQGFLLGDHCGYLLSDRPGGGGPPPPYWPNKR